MGFNPTRRYRDPAGLDIALLAVAVIVIGGLVAWASGVF